MDIKELRIGNLIYNRKNKIIKVNPFTFFMFNFFSYKYLPINDYILLKIGFLKVEGGFQIYINHHTFIEKCNSTGWWLCQKDNLLSLKDFKNIHEIQNLYFSISGQELTIKE